MKCFRTKFNVLALAFSATVMAFSFAACGSGDDEPETPDQPTTEDPAAYYGYEVEFGEDYLEFYNVTVTYTTPDGKDQTEAVTKAWKYEFNGKKSELPSTLTFKVNAQVKDDISEINAERTYVFSHKINLICRVSNPNGGSSSLLSSPALNSSVSYPGSKVQDYLDARPSHEWINKTYEIK